MRTTPALLYSQVSDPGLAHGAGDGLHGRAQRVQQRRQLPGALRLPALLHDEAGHGDHVGVEGASLGHGGGVEAAGNAAGLKCTATRNWSGGLRERGPIRSCGRGVETLLALCKLMK